MHIHGGKVNLGSGSLCDVPMRLTPLIRWTHRAVIKSILLIPSPTGGEDVATGDQIGVLALWNGHGTFSNIFYEDIHTGQVMSIIYHPRRDSLLSASADHTIIETNRDGEILHILEDHTNWVCHLGMRLNEREFCSSSYDQTILRWRCSDDAENPPEVISCLRGHSYFVTVSIYVGNEERLVSSSYDGSAILWDLATNSQLHHFNHSYGIQRINHSALSPMGRFLATGGDDGVLKIWSMATAGLQTQFSHESSIRWTTFVSDTQVATASEDKTVRIWDVDSGKEIAVLKGHSDQVNQCRVIEGSKSPLLISASNDKTLRLWNSSVGQEQCCTDHIHPVISTACSRLHVVSGSMDKTVVMYKLS